MLKRKEDMVSGGHFNYQQYAINEIADSIERELSASPDSIQSRLRDAIRALKIAAIYAQRVDWLFSGDDSDETFIKRLDKELAEFRKDKI